MHLHPLSSNTRLLLVLAGICHHKLLAVVAHGETRVSFSAAMFCTQESVKNFLDPFKNCEREYMAWLLGVGGSTVE